MVDHSVVEVQNFKMKENKRQAIKKLQRKIFKNKKQFDVAMNNFLLEMKLEITYLLEEQKKLRTAIKVCSNEEWIK